MKLLKRLGLTFLIVIATLLVMALFVSKEFNYEESIIIDQPIGLVWEHTNSLEDLETWSPWNDYDPNMKKVMEGVDGTVGAQLSWESENPDVGKGSQIISKIEEPTLFATTLKFYSPYESEAKGYVKLQAEGNKTRVTWGFESEIPYPFNLMKLTMDMEGTIGKDFKLGLSKLKKLCEKESSPEPLS